MYYAIFVTLLLMLIGIAGYILAYLFLNRLSIFLQAPIWIISAFVLAFWILHLYAVFQSSRLLYVMKILSRLRLEHLAIFVGIFCGGAQAWYNNRKEKKQNIFTRHNGLVLTILLMVPVHIFPIIDPVEKELDNKWKDGVCLQTTAASCGPCCVATMLNIYGIRKSEKEIAPKVFLSGMGSDFWHLARYLRMEGLEVEIVKLPRKPHNLPTPLLAMVHQEGQQFYHCIVVFNIEEDVFEIGDPSAGRRVLPKDYIFREYSFVGYGIHVKNQGKEKEE